MPEQNRLMVIEKETKDLLVELSKFFVTGQESYEVIASWKIDAANRRKIIKIILDPMVQNAKEAYDKNRAERDKYLKPVIQCEDIMKRKIKDYENKKAFEAEQKRKKLAAEAEAEQKRKQKEAQKEAEAEAKEFGVPVEEVAVEEVEVEAPMPVHTIDKVKGLGIKKVWNVYIIDKNKIPLSFLEPNMVALRNQARLDKENFNIEGCEARYE